MPFAVGVVDSRGGFCVSDRGGVLQKIWGLWIRSECGRLPLVKKQTKERKKCASVTETYVVSAPRGQTPKSWRRCADHDQLEPLDWLADGAEPLVFALQWSARGARTSARWRRPKAGRAHPQ